MEDQRTRDHPRAWANWWATDGIHTSHMEGQFTESPTAADDASSRVKDWRSIGTDTDKEDFRIKRNLFQRIALPNSQDIRAHVKAVFLRERRWRGVSQQNSLGKHLFQALELLGVNFKIALISS